MRRMGIEMNSKAVTQFLLDQEPKLPSIRPELRNMTVVMGEELLVDCELENSEEFNVLQYYVHKLGVGGENHRVKVCLFLFYY